jgi:4'-phosphopantetheinyl transferase EntD
VHWYCDPGIASAAVLTWPRIEDTALALIAKQNPEASLLAQEAALTPGMGDKRLQDFVSGRHSAHLAQTLLGLPASPVLRDGRSPVWSEGLSGSISHSKEWALAGVSSRYRSIGVDVEVCGRVTGKLHETVFRPEEIHALADLPPDAAGVLFSAKEAGYKAIHPLVGEFVGFHEAAIELDWPGQQFRIRYLGDNPKNKALESGVGFWRLAENHVITVFLIQE